MGLQLPGIPKNSERTPHANLVIALAVGGDKRNYCSDTSFIVQQVWEKKGHQKLPFVVVGGLNPARFNTIPSFATSHSV